MKRFLVAFCGFVLLSSLTSCIEVFEKLLVNSNGGGHFSRTLDMSQMMEMMNSLKSMDKDKDSKSEEPATGDEMDPNTMGKTISEDEKILKTLKGISNVTSSADTVKGIYTLEFDFANDAALNEAINKTGDKKDKAESVFSIKGSTVALSDYNMMKQFEQSDAKGDNKEMAELAAGMMEEIKYHLIISLPGSVKSVSNKKAEISDDKKTVTLDANVKELSEKKVTTAMKINYK